MSLISKIKWSKEDYTLESFVDLFSLPQVVRIKTNLKGKNDGGGQTQSSLSNDVFVLHSVRNKEVIRATDSLKNEFYLPHDSTTKVEVMWKDYKKAYDNIEEMFKDFPKHVLVVKEDECLRIQKGDVLKLKRMTKIRENVYLTCAVLDKNRAEVHIPFNYKGLFKTLGDLETEFVYLKDAVDFCKLPRIVRFIDNKLKLRGQEDASKCPTVLSSLGPVTLHEVTDHDDVIASQTTSDGRMVMTSIPLDREDIIIIAPTSESRTDPNYTRLCERIDRETTAEMIKNAGILHKEWEVFEEDNNQSASSWNQLLLSLTGLGIEDGANDHPANPSINVGWCISVDEEAPIPLPRKVKKEALPPPPIPPKIPLSPTMGKGFRKATERREQVFPADPSYNDRKSKSLGRILTPSQGNKRQVVDEIIKERFGGADKLNETENGYVWMASNVPHLQTKYECLYESMQRYVEQEQGDSKLSVKVLPCPTEPQKSSRRGKTLPRGLKPQSVHSMGNELTPSLTPSRPYKISPGFNDSEEQVHLKIKFQRSGTKCEVYSQVPLVIGGAEADQANDLTTLTKHPGKTPKGLAFINDKNVRRWSQDEVLKFLEFIHLKKHKKAFKARKIDGQALAALDNKELSDMGVHSSDVNTIRKFVHECMKYESSALPNE